MKQQAQNLNCYSMRVEWSDEDNCWIARSPEWVGLSAFGETRQEAIREAEIALDGMIVTAIEHGIKLPLERKLDVARM